MERAELDAVNTKRRKEQEKLKSDYRSLLLQRLKEQEVFFSSLHIYVCLILKFQSDVNWRKSLGIHDDTESDFYVVEECVEEILEEKIDVVET